MKRFDYIGVLEHLVKHGTEKRGEAIVLMYDEEDGFWLSTIDCGVRHFPVKDLDDIKRTTLRQAIRAAAEWHNEEAKKPWRSHVKPVVLT